MVIGTALVKLISHKMRFSHGDDNLNGNRSRILCFTQYVLKIDQRLQAVKIAQR